jgi:hypothetical protein
MSGFDLVGHIQQRSIFDFGVILTSGAFWRISTSYVERSNLTMRMSMRRFTRLTNGYSKKVENHAAMVAVYFTWYNFGRVHHTLKTTPAVAAGVADHVWSVDEMVELLSSVEPKSTRPAVSN